MTTLAVDTPRGLETSLEPVFTDLPVIASDIIYRGSAVGDNGSGYMRPLVAGDPFRGFAEEQCDNSAGSAGDKTVRIRQQGAAQLTVTGVTAVTDVESLVYATDDAAFTLTQGTGTPIGRIIRWVTSTTCIVYFLADQLSPPASTSGVLDSIRAGDSSFGITGLPVTSGAGGAVVITGGATTTSGAGGASSLIGGAGSGASTGGAAVVTGGAGGETDGTGGAMLATGGVGGATNSVGGAATVKAGAGLGTGAGAVASVVGGAGGTGGATGNGGVAKVVGGAALSTNGTGGAAQVTGGLGTGNGAGGAITITSGAAGATGVAGVVSIAVGAATAGNGSALTLTGGAGAGSTNSGGNIDLIPGAAVSTGTPGEVVVNGAAGIEVITLNYVAALVTQTIFTAFRAYRVKAIMGRTRVAGSGGACTIAFFKCATTVAVGSGTALHSGSFDLVGTADANQTLTISTTVATVNIAAGDSIGYVLTGTATSAVGNVTITLVPI